jgi:hypothetical protein
MQRTSIISSKKHWNAWLATGHNGDGFIKDPMTALSQAIKNADSQAYDIAYRQLTDGCNSCHQATNVGVNVIAVPDASIFPDQDFRAAKP